MSSSSKHPLPVNSDESNSTEHDATVSLSGTDELNDNQSIFSDTGSRASRVNDTRKAIQKMNKLKEENALLKEALEKANATDITTLKSKLRGSHADLVRLRQNNSELKDRIQILEGRLFSALSMTSTAVKNTNDISTASDANREIVSAIETDTMLPTHFMEPPQKERFTNGDRAHLMDMIRSLQSRCKHLARLVQSYETKMSVLQAEVDGRTSSHVTEPSTQPPTHNTTHNIDFTLDTIYQNKEQAFSAANELSNAPLKSALKGKPTNIHPPSTTPTEPTIKAHNTNNTNNTNNQSDTSPVTTSTTTTRKLKVKVQQEELDAQIQQARLADIKLIRELSNEIRRLVALIPREKMDPEINTNSLQNGKENESETQHESAEESEPESSSSDVVTKTSTEVNRTTSLAPMKSSATTIMDVSQNRNIVNVITEQKGVQYTHGDVLCSFFVGIFVMLICVALSTYFASPLPDLKPAGKV